MDNNNRTPKPVDTDQRQHLASPLFVPSILRQATSSPPTPAADSKPPSPSTVGSAFTAFERNGDGLAVGSAAPCTWNTRWYYAQPPSQPASTSTGSAVAAAAAVAYLQAAAAARSGTNGGELTPGTAEVEERRQDRDAGCVRMTPLKVHGMRLLCFARYRVVPLNNQLHR